MKRLNKKSSLQQKERREICKSESFEPSRPNEDPKKMSKVRSWSIRP